MRTIVLLCIAALLAVCDLAAAQERSYRDGPVTELTYVRTKSGHFDDYMKFLDTKYKTEMEAYKKAGLIIGYAVYGANPRSPSEPDLVLAVTYPNFAALDQTEKFESISVKINGNMDTQNKAAADRGEWRQILGGELVRELLLK